MEQAIQFNIGGIKCDNASCDYRDDTVKVEDYPNWLNKPCPKCSANLLTEDDYKTVQMLLKTTNLINSMTSEQLQTFVGNSKNDEITQLNIEMNGTGNIKFDIKD